jgi:hypothetical protein
VSRRAPAFSDEVWREIVKAAAPMTPDDQAPAAMDECIHAYFGLQVDPERLRQSRDRWRKVAKLARELGHELYEVKRRTPWTVPDSDRPQRDLRAVRSVQYHAESQVEGFEMRLHARQGRRDPSRGWLWGRLFGIWTDHFGGRLTVTVPPGGGALTGALVRFFAVVFDRVLDETVSPHTIRDGIRRERKRRARSNKGKFDRKK